MFSVDVSCVLSAQSLDEVVKISAAKRIGCNVIRIHLTSEVVGVIPESVKT